MTIMLVTEKLAGIALGLKAEEIKPSSFQAAIKFLIDTFGCAIAGHNQPGINEARELFSGYGGRPEAELFFSNIKLPLSNAAFVNSAMIHALDYDDVYIPGTLHLSSTIVAPVLGAAKMNSLSGREFLTAIITAVEVAGLLGIAEAPYRKGEEFLPSTLVNGFGAVAGMARAFGMDTATTVDAFGLNYAQVGGNRQALMDKTTAKRFQGAFAARNAIYATELAHCGIAGPPRAFEGNAGYCKCYLNDSFTSNSLLHNPEDLQIEHISFKRYASCGAAHNVQIAAENLMRQENITVDEIEKVEIFGCSENGIVGGKFALSRTPQADAQFSAAWAVAHAIVRGPARLKDYQNENIAADTEVVAFCDKISYTEMPEGLKYDREPAPLFPVYYVKPQGIIAHTYDGRRIIKAQAPTDTFDPANYPMDVITDKYYDCCNFSGLGDKLDFDRILNALMNLKDAVSLDEFLHSICPDK